MKHGSWRELEILTKEHKISDSFIILNSLLFFCVFSVTEYIVILGNNKKL